MELLTKQSGWRCDYTLDDSTGDVLSVACAPASASPYRDPISGRLITREPPGYTRDVVGWQAEAGEECQLPSDEAP